MTARPTSTTPTITRLTVAVLRMPLMLTRAKAASSATATGRACSGHRYVPATSEIAATDAVLPTRNSRPALNPDQPPANEYTPPETGLAIASWAVLSALRLATTP